MSRSFNIRPVDPPPPVEASIGLSMAHIVGGRVFNDIEEVDKSNINGVCLDKTWLPWLEGILVVAEGEIAVDADTLISQIKQHGEIEIVITR